MLTPVLGITVWYLLFWLPLQIEWTAPDARTAVLALYLCPLAILTFGAVTRWASLLLLTFPISLIPGLMLMPELDQRVFQTLEGWGSVAIALLGYIATAALWANTRPPRRATPDLHPRQLPTRPHDRQPRAPTQTGAPTPDEPLRDGRDLLATPRPLPPRHRDLWWPYRNHFLPRLILLTLLLLVPLYGLNFADTATAGYTASFGDQAAAARVMANLLHLFVWIVIAYLFFISPGLNLELEQRQLDHTILQLEARLEARTPTWRIVGATVLAFALVALFIALRLT